MISWRRFFCLATGLFVFNAHQVGAGVRGSHLVPPNNPNAEQRPTEVEPGQSSLSPELTQKFEAQISLWAKDITVEPASASEFLDELAQGLSEKEQNELFSTLLEKYPESSINALWRRQVEARLKSLKGLIHDIGINEEGDVLAIRRADQIELQRRIQKELGVNSEEARRLSLIVGSGGAQPYNPQGQGSAPAKNSEQKLRLGLSQAFKPEELRKLEEGLLKASPQDPAIGELKSKFLGGLKLIRIEGAPTTPSVFPGNLESESRNGNFYAESDNSYRATLLTDAILKNGGNVTFTGVGVSRDFEGEPGVRFQLGSRRQKWFQDSRGLPVKDAEGKTYLVDAKYHGGKTDDTLPETEGAVSGLRVKPFGAFVEGGNVMAIPRGKDGKPLVITSDGYTKTNALLDGAYPEFAEKLFKTQFASDGRKVLQVPMPQDGTRHVDMNLSQPDMDKPTVFLTTYLDKHVDLLSSQDQRHARASLSLLDETERMLKPYVDVIRVPQAPPVTTSDRAYPTHFSRLNALYFNNPSGEKVAIVPDYPNYPHLEVNTEINGINRIALEKMGYQKVISTPSQTAEEHGSFHCMFPQVCY